MIISIIFIIIIIIMIFVMSMLELSPEDVVILFALTLSILQLVCSLLSPDLTVLEYGSGGSTTLFSPFVAHWTSVEHNAYWAETVNNTLKRLELSHKVSLFSVPNDLPWKGDGGETEFKSYINFPATLGQKYDLILDDGRARVAVR